MSDRRYEVRFTAPVGEACTGVFTLKDKPGDVCCLELSLDGHNYASEERDFFDALQEIRRELEQVSILPICYGACENAWPSGMARDMARGCVVYLTEMGVSGGKRVGTFDSDQNTVPATVEKQIDFHHRWMGSWIEKSESA
ncbi:MAG: hypothetical protein AAF078_03165 [Planctomycetota bacterium]